MGALACAALVDQFACPLAVCFRAGVAGGVAENRPSGHRCVRELHGALDDGVEDLVAECVHDARPIHSKEVLAPIVDAFGDKVFDTVI